jgi:hypothetical protein
MGSQEPVKKHHFQRDRSNLLLLLIRIIRFFDRMMRMWMIMDRKAIGKWPTSGWTTPYELHNEGEVKEPVEESESNGVVSS